MAITRRQPVPLRRREAPKRSQLDAAIEEWDRLRAQKAELDAELTAAHKAVLRLLKTKTHTATLPDGSKVKVTRVEGHRAYLNQEKLKKKIGAPAFKKLCTMMFDRSKFDLAMANGELEPVVVASCVEETPNEPYVRITKS